VEPIEYLDLSITTAIAEYDRGVMENFKVTTNELNELIQTCKESLTEKFQEFTEGVEQRIEQVQTALFTKDFTK
jgi:hypothetical protein